MGRQGQRKRVPNASEGARDRMWKSMRMLRHFTTADLVATAFASHTNAAKYVRALVHAGYLRCIAPKREGIAGGHAAYQLVRNSGPVAPRIGLDGVFDANLPRDEQVANKRIRKHGLTLLRLVLAISDAAEPTDDTGWEALLARAQETRRFVAEVWSAPL